MLDRSQYPQYKTMSNWGASAPQAAFRASEYAQMPDVNAAFDMSQYMPGGTGYTPTDTLAFLKRPDALSAGQGSWMDSLKGVGQSVKDFLPDNFLTSTDAKGVKTDGWGGTALGVANGLFSGYMGMKQYGLSKDIFENNKQQFDRNFGAQAKLTNSSLSDRQDRRNADAKLNGTTTQSTEDYMKKYGVA